MNTIMIKPIISFSISRFVLLLMLVVCPLSLRAYTPSVLSEYGAARAPQLGQAAVYSSAWGQRSQAAQSAAPQAPHQPTGTIAMAALQGRKQYLPDLMPDGGLTNPGDLALAEQDAMRRAPGGGGSSTGSFNDLPLADGVPFLLALAGLYLATIAYRRRRLAH